MNGNHLETLYPDLPWIKDYSIGIYVEQNPSCLNVNVQLIYHIKTFPSIKFQEWSVFSIIKGKLKYYTDLSSISIQFDR